MNKLIPVILLCVSAIGINSYADNDCRDCYEEIFSCRLINSDRDVKMKLSLFEGGIAGLTKIEIKRETVGHREFERYYVKEQFSEGLGSPIVYVGRSNNKKIKFSINMTTPPQRGRTRQALLVTLTNGQDNPSFEKLKCKAN
ncbi:MAG: hypothetical protein A2Z20_03385 [Bdellovibrionales bacterium RBG_16_40_8]|nr:MAG: hypothetical protein A2Z20_03385 [Bdellovibrionales bacterium RBG_16_40_8]